MQIRKEEVVEKKKIGDLDGEDVYAVRTKGGFNAVIKGGSGAELLGVGSHPGIALHIAKKKKPKLRVTALTKSMEVDPATYKQFIPYWEEYTDKLRGKIK